MKSIYTFLMMLAVVVTTQAQQEQAKDTVLGTKVVLDEVLVSSVRVKAQAPITHSNISKAQLAKRNLGQDIPILMNYMPSVVTTSDAGAGIGYTGIRVRGSDATRVNVTINGIPYNDTESMGTFWVDLPDFASNVESIQLQRGVGTSTNGAGAFGASLNLLTNAVSREAQGEIANSFGSFNTRKHTVKYSTGLLNNHFEVTGSLSKISSDGYVDRASSDLKSYFLQASYVDDNTLIKALVFGGFEETYQSWAGVDAKTLKEDRTFNEYTYENQVDHYNQDHFQLHWNEKWNTNWSSNLAVHYTRGKGYYEQYKEEEDFDDYGFAPIVIGEETIDKTDLVRRKWLDNDFYGTTFSVNYKKNRLDFLLGGAYNKYEGDHFGKVIWAQYASNSKPADRYYDYFGDKSDLSLYAKADYKISDELSAYGDLQYRRVVYEATGEFSDVDDTFSFFNPKAGLTYMFSKANSIYASYAVANREPNRDNYENGAIKPERLHDIELGWRHQSQALIVNANLYYMNYKDQLVLTGALSQDTGSPLAKNIGDSYRLGLEVDVLVKLTNKISVRPNITLSSNKNKDYFFERDGVLSNLGDTNISFSPNVIFGNVINYMPLDGLNLSFLSKYVGEQYMGNIDADSSKLSDYFTSDFNVQYELKMNSVFKSIVFTGLVNNVFNRLYESNGFFYTYDDTWSTAGKTTTVEGAGYYPQAGTNFLIGATIKF